MRETQRQTALADGRKVLSVKVCSSDNSLSGYVLMIDWFNGFGWHGMALHSWGAMAGWLTRQDLADYRLFVYARGNA